MIFYCSGYMSDSLKIQMRSFSVHIPAYFFSSLVFVCSVSRVEKKSFTRSHVIWDTLFLLLLPSSTGVWLNNNQAVEGNEKERAKKYLLVISTTT